MAINDEIVRVASLALSQAARGEGKARLAPGALNPFGNTEEQRRLVRDVLSGLLAAGKLGDATMRDLETLTAQLAGLGPLDPLVKDPSVVSIQVLGPDTVLAYRGGAWEPAGVSWSSPAALRRYAGNLAPLTGQALDAEHLVVEGNFRNPAGRIQIDATARTEAGVTIHVRIGRRNPITLAQMVADGGMSAEMFELIVEIARRDVGVLFVGQPGVGKTTFLEACLDYWPRLPAAAIDDRSEFWPRHPLCTLYDVPSGRLAQALVNVLRKNVSRVAVAEVRGDEAAEMLRYAGAVMVYTTLHGTVDNAVLRLMALVKGAPASPYADLSADDVRRVIAAAFPFMIELEKLTVGGRARFFVSRLAYLDEAGNPVSLFEAEVDGPRITGFVQHRSPEAVLSRYRKRVWGGSELPDLETINALFKSHPKAALKALVEFLRVHPGDARAVALLKRVAAQDPVRSEVAAQLDAHAAGVRQAVAARDWATAHRLRSALLADPLLATVSGGEVGDALVGLDRKLALTTAAQEVLALGASPQNVLALIGLRERMRLEPEAYPADLVRQVSEFLQELEGGA